MRQQEPGVTRTTNFDLKRPVLNIFTIRFLTAILTTGTHKHPMSQML